MGVKKLQRLFNGGAATNNIGDKEEVEQYQKIIAEKLRDPQMAKKAAMIIERMLKEKMNSNK
ncbi:MAG: hypothetical protein ACJAT2_001003 [Bacteriovoracaceae bacterium]|jgi:hypothetical protein